MKKGMKVVIAGAFGLFVVCFGVMAWFCSYLRSPAGSKWMLSQLKGVIAQKANARLEYSEANIDPFSLVHFKDLRFIQETGGGRTEITVNSIDLQYSFSILSRKVEIEKIEINHPTVFFRSVSNQAELKKAEPPHEDNSSVQKLSEWIIAPLIQISLHHFSLIGLSLDLDSQTPDFHLKTKMKNIGFRFNLDWARRRLSSQGEFQLDEPGQMTLTTFKGSDKTEIQLSPFASGKWAGGIRFEQSKWIYEVQPSDFGFGLKDLLLVQSSPGTDSRLTWSNLNWSSKVKVYVKTQDLFQLDQKSLESFDSVHTFTAGPLVFHQTRAGQKEKIQLGSWVTTFKTDVADGFRLHSSSNAKNLFSDNLSIKPATFDFNVTTEVPRDWSRFKVLAQTTVNAVSLFDLKAEGKTGSNLEVLSQMKVFLDSRLSSIFRGAEALNETGTLLTDLDLNVHAKYATASLLGIKADQLMKAPIDGDLSIQGTWIDPIHLQSHFSWIKDVLKLNGLFKVQNEDAFRIEASSIFKPDAFEINSTLEAFTGNYLNGILTRQQIDQAGQWAAKTQLGVQVQMPKSKLVSLLQGGVIHANAKTQLTQKKRPEGARSAGLIIVAEPIVIQNDLELDHGKARIEMTAVAPTAEVSHVGRVSDTRFSTSVHSPNVMLGNSFDVALEFNQGEVLLDKTPPLAGLNMKLKASSQGENRFVLNEFFAEFNHSMAKIQAEATGNTKSRDFQTQGVMTVQVPDHFPAIAGTSIQGRVQFPWTLSILKGRDIHFEGNMDVFDLNLSQAPLRVQGVNGRIPVSEDFIWDGKKVKFAYLITQNPFERVDYERLQPMIHATDQMKINEIGFEEKTYGPFQGFFSMRQNMIFAHKFDLNLGSGRSNGEMYFDVLPQNIQIGILSRLTGLNLNEVLPKKYLVGTPKADQNLSGRMGVVVNLNSGLIDGRVDVTEIGREQLMTLFNVLDPQYVNEQLNRARFALGIAYPKMVEMSFQKGYLDMGVTLGGVMSQQFSLRGIPMTAWVSDATASLVKKGKEVPLR
jgi:hypothetical protein